MDDTALLLAHMDDLARRAQRTGAAFSRFLSPAQQAAVSRAFARRADVTLTFHGGFRQAERALAVFLNPEWGSLRPEDAVAAIALHYRRQDTLGHRDILGALMALGVKREVIGDIEVQNPVYLACTAEMAPYLAENLTQAGRIGLKPEIIPLETLPDRAIVMNYIKDTIASPRLDAIVAVAFGLSRSAAAEYIRAGQVQLEYQECLDIARQVPEGAIFSLRGQGKAQLVEIGSQSRKGRTWITVGKYV